nr:transposase [sulfur-oxidizing endosymbiont of Gigantopelta aegis]
MNDQTKKPNKSYTSEFKESAVKLANETDQPVSQTARELGVNVNTLHTWISKYSKLMCQHFSGQFSKYFFGCFK